MRRYLDRSICSSSFLLGDFSNKTPATTWRSVSRDECDELLVQTSVLVGQTRELLLAVNGGVPLIRFSIFSMCHFLLSRGERSLVKVINFTITRAINAQPILIIIYIIIRDKTFETEIDLYNNFIMYRIFYIYHDIYINLISSNIFYTTRHKNYRILPQILQIYLCLK